MSKTAVLAYSGGLDTSCAIAWLKEDYGFDEVVAVLVDVGQEADFDIAVGRGKAAGADDVVVVDKRDAFAEDQVAKALLANALYEGKYPLVSALSRPVIADVVAGLALELEADAVVHGCTGKGNDQLRFELAFRSRYPGVQVIAPLRDTIWTRDAEIALRARAGDPGRGEARVAVLDRRQPLRPRDRGGLIRPWAAPPEGAYALTKSPAATPPPATSSSARGGPACLARRRAAGARGAVASMNRRAGAYGSAGST